MLQELKMILDVTVGARKFYFNWDKKLGDNLVGIDLRKGDFSREHPKLWTKETIIIKPTVLADMKHLPFKECSFEAIIFDPPHTDASLQSWLGKYYGSWTQKERIETLRIVNKEFPRVLRSGGTLILKVIPRQFPVYETLLKNFIFFLPISTYRTRGSYAKQLGKGLGALWAIGIKR